MILSYNLCPKNCTSTAQVVAKKLRLQPNLGDKTHPLNHPCSTAVIFGQRKGDFQFWIDGQKIAEGYKHEGQSHAKN